jgi:glycine cleavage system regulatory protein
VVVERSAEPDAAPAKAIRLEVIGNDRPGIVRDISRVLAQQQVNIEDLETDVVSAPMQGDMLFRARATLRVPSSVTVARLRSMLEALAGEIMVDLTLGEKDINS